MPLQGSRHKKYPTQDCQWVTSKTFCHITILVTICHLSVNFATFWQDCENSLWPHSLRYLRGSPSNIIAHFIHISLLNWNVKFLSQNRPSISLSFSREFVVTIFFLAGIFEYTQVWIVFKRSLLGYNLKICLYFRLAKTCLTSSWWKWNSTGSLDPTVPITSLSISLTSGFLVAYSTNSFCKYTVFTPWKLHE